MHHYIYPSKDTYISSRPGYTTKNFGIDEMLQIGTSNTIIRSLESTKDYTYTSAIFDSYPVQLFTGIFTGSLRGNVVSMYGTLSGSLLEFTTTYSSGSRDGGAISEYSGSISGSFNGFLSGSFSSSFWVELFTGQLTGSTGCLYGTASGIDTKNEQNWTTTTTKFIDRSLIQFNLDTISASISNGTILSPQFHLKLKVCNEYELPITYTIYALPLSQSWNMGNGYFSDGGSTDGVSWKYKDFNNGQLWYNTYNSSSTRPPIDFITYPSNASSSFAYGGGTWYTSSASQTFNYETSDIDMDVTNIVMSWISGSIPNNGFILISSDELQSTGSGFTLKFFSRDTNTIYYPYLDVMWAGNSIAAGGNEFITGSISTGSVTISTIDAGIDVTVQSGSTLSISGGITGMFSGSTYFTVTAGDLTYNSMSGIVDGKGLSGSIKGVPVIGAYSGIMTVSTQSVTGPCGKTFDAYFVTASFNTGIFSGSSFTSYYIDNKLENAILTGSWTDAALLGSNVNIPIPSGIEPYAYAYVVGTYVNGKALGTYTLSGSNSASFVGQFTEGPFLGGYINYQLSGSIYTSSYSYTSSVTFNSTTLDALNVLNPYTVVLQNVHSTYKSGDMIKFGVFGRKQFPLKTFGISTQQTQYLIPEYLPTSSYYALKDNETGEIIMGFDNYTQLSCEYPTGNYFVIDTTSLPQERLYKILIRIENNGCITTVDCGKTFKITR